VKEMNVDEMEFNYIRMTWNNWGFVSSTFRNHVKIDKLVRMICNYCKRRRVPPRDLMPDRTYGLVIEMGMAYVYSLTASELMITTNSDEKTLFGKSFSEEIALEIKKRTMEYWERVKK